MNKAEEQIKEILASHGEDFLSNTWIVPGGKSRAIHHHCTERMAAKEGIKFSMPEIVSADPNNVVIIVKGTASTGTEAWSFGEASPKNNKNSYPFSMAEKRAKDRVALKLLKLHGLVYSETEADEFKRPDDPPAVKQRVANAREAAVAYVSLARTAMQNCITKEEAVAWWYDEVGNREKNDVVEGTPEYKALAADFNEFKRGLPYADLRAAG
jgi:hypothetical protein